MKCRMQSDSKNIEEIIELSKRLFITPQVVFERCNPRYEEFA